MPLVLLPLLPLLLLLLQPRLVIACVGPFRLYGEPVFKACAEAGTDYVDICGEPGVWGVSLNICVVLVYVCYVWGRGGEKGFESVHSVLCVMMQL
jgi:saccharopine dehydrogenase-like NADP-dependent oxidoreductase